MQNAGVKCLFNLKEDPQEMNDLAFDPSLSIPRMKSDWKGCLVVCRSLNSNDKDSFDARM